MGWSLLNSVSRLSDEPLVSIIIPVHERADVLEVALASMKEQTYRSLELIVVDDKSRNKGEIERICRKASALYLRNDSRAKVPQRALARNIGLARSTGEIIVFLDQDMILPVDSIEGHVSWHRAEERVAISCQVWNLTLDRRFLRRSRFTSEELREASQPFIQDSGIVWSRRGSVHRSKNWWAFLSGECSFRRSDVMRLNGWDPFFEGWGGEDNEIGYRIVLNGMDIIYCEDVKAFHVLHEVGPRERYERSVSALKNIEYMCWKFPELSRYDRLIDRRRELEEFRRRYEGERVHESWLHEGSRIIKDLMRKWRK